jgi:transcription elongation factor GreA-like protein
MQWRELALYYGNWRSVHKRDNAWSMKKIWTKLLTYISEDYDKENIMIDTTIIRAHPCSAGYKKIVKLTRH